MRVCVRERERGEGACMPMLSQYKRMHARLTACTHDAQKETDTVTDWLGLSQHSDTNTNTKATLKHCHALHGCVETIFSHSRFLQ